MTRKECNRAWQIDALREERLGPHEAESFRRHRRVCSACARRIAGDLKIRALGQRLPASGDPTEFDLRRVREHVIREVVTSDGRRSRRATPPRAGIALALVVMSAGAWAFSARRAARVPVHAATSTSAATAAQAIDDEPLAGSVVATSAARWRQTRAARVERVILDEGTLHVHVRPQRSGERFLVEVPDGELEVRGTTFDVVVRDRSTTRVHVEEGTVRIRVAGQPAMDVIADETWPPPPSALRVLPSPERRELAGVSPPRSHTALDAGSATAVSPNTNGGATVVADDGLSQYSDAMRLLRSRRYEEAAEAFHVFAVGHPLAPQAEDASFLEAVALAHDGRLDAASVIAAHHLANFPQSFHRKEAAILVGTAASERGDCGKARAVLLPWLGSVADAEATRALRACDR
jgi:FecR-like protein